MTEKAGDTSLEAESQISYWCDYAGFVYIRYSTSELIDLKANHELQYT